MYTNCIIDLYPIDRIFQKAEYVLVSVFHNIFCKSVTDPVNVLRCKHLFGSLIVTDPTVDLCYPLIQSFDLVNDGFCTVSVLSDIHQIAAPFFCIFLITPQYFYLQVDHTFLYLAVCVELIDKFLIILGREDTCPESVDDHIIQILFVYSLYSRAAAAEPVLFDRGIVFAGPAVLHMTAELFAAFSAEDLSVKRIVILAVVVADPVLVVMEPLLHLVKQFLAYDRLYCSVYLIVVLFLLMAVPTFCPASSVLHPILLTVKISAFWL